MDQGGILVDNFAMKALTFALNYFATTFVDRFWK